MENASTVDRHRMAFLEEAREILGELETSLLELNERPDDSELVGRVFRAMHTIKGSGAMFGFDDVAAFTHHLESAYDTVRNGRLTVGSTLIDLSLEALDQIRAMLGAASGEGTAADAAVVDSILSRLHGLTGAGQPHEACAPVAPAVLDQGPEREWMIGFTPGAEMLRNGSDPLLLLRDLGRLGAMRVEADVSALPPLVELDPERCYLRWTVTLTTAEQPESIRDVFIFVEDCCELSVVPMPVAGRGLPPRALEDLRTGGGRREYDKPDNASSIRVPAAKLDQLVNLVGELVTVQARLSQVAARSGDLDIAAVAEEIERLTSSLRENSMSVRMLPIRGTFERFRRLVHDLARDLGKNVELTIDGAETELDKTVIDQLNDPLMHLIRNSMDHGLEPPAERLAQGKPPMASIQLSARHCGAHVLISVTDDGRGIDAEAVRQKAIRQGLVEAEAKLSESEIFALILLPGFSTARQITDVSGRGVGMDVVKQSVDALRGTIEIASQPGVGTSMTLRLPLTLAIIDGLLVRVENSFFVLPLANTLECIELTRQDIEAAHGKQVAIVRGEIVPYIRLRDFFAFASERPEREQIMVSETEDGRYGFVVDEVLGDHQTVIKNLGRLFRHVQFVSGATILGNGAVALILDPHRLVQDAVRTLAQAPRAWQGGGESKQGTTDASEHPAEAAFRASP